MQANNPVVRPMHRSFQKRSWTVGNLYRRKDGEKAEFIGLQPYTIRSQTMSVPAFRHPNGQECMHYWGPVIPYITHDLKKDTELYGNMCIMEDDNEKDLSCC